MRNDEMTDWPPRPCERGSTGRVLFHRLDESCLLVGVLERDEAERVAAVSRRTRPSAGAADGLRNPAPAGWSRRDDCNWAFIDGAAGGDPRTRRC